MIENKSKSRKTKENEDPNSQNTCKKYKYFSKKHKNNEKPNQKLSNSDMTVEVFLFDDKTETKPSYEQPRTVGHRSPLSNSVEHLCKKPKAIGHPQKPKICLPVYHKYINQT